MTSRGKFLVDIALKKNIINNENSCLEVGNVINSEPSQVNLKSQQTKSGEIGLDVVENFKVDDLWEESSLSDLFSSDGDDEYKPDLNDLSSSDESLKNDDTSFVPAKYNGIDENSVLTKDDNDGMNNSLTQDESGGVNNVLPGDDSDGVNNVIVIDEEQPKKKQKTFNLPEKKTRKRQRNPDEWKKRKAAVAREQGKAYLSQSGKNIEAKKVNTGILCNEKCRYKCSNNFTVEHRNDILSSFYKLEQNSKNVFLFKSIVSSKVNRIKSDANKHKSASYTFFVTCNSVSVRVCKKAFCSLFQVGMKKIDLVIGQIKRGLNAPPPNLRGHHSSRPHKIKPDVKNYIMQHISSFPADESHYSRNVNPNKKYLSPQLNLSKMYELYVEQCKIEGQAQYFFVKKSTYRHLFETEYNLSFGQPKSDTCTTCDAGNDNEEHKENYRYAFELQKLDREEAQNNNIICFMTIDLQQTMPLPRLTTSKAFYLRQMWLYNLGVHIISKQAEKADFFNWTEDIANRGSSEICSCLLTLTELDHTVKSKDHLVIWSDSCSGQNKNFLIVLVYQYLVLKGFFKVIDHKFPEVGHSYLDSDRDFGKIEKILRKHENIYLPEQYREIIAKAGKKNTVVDMKQHFRDFGKLGTSLNLYNRKVDLLQEKVRFRDGIKWIRVDEYGSYLYKETYDPNTPFRKVSLIRKKDQQAPSSVQIPRYKTPQGSLTEEKIKNLHEQMPFVKEEFRWFYDNVFQQVTVRPKNNKKKTNREKENQ